MGEIVGSEAPVQSVLQSECLGHRCDNCLAGSLKVGIRGHVKCLNPDPYILVRPYLRSGKVFGKVGSGQQGQDPKS